ncbi:DUF7269 family protein [Halopiger xanaduensis]|uniref:Uncharacterized protein n=1 Tax=Halopiger xanaduensis (strain DSM 18323 / JCM 14033 / SH-6) TaxID=797210 RepID=F8DAH4_HALXS|nr:hypothetical protein [Halopiger xanaduensis]AEH35779.1 hypothetical protein Halxa_1146 [Halopiger xanaduensis SH-6]
MSGAGYSKTNALLVLVTLAALSIGAVLATAPSVLPAGTLEAVATVEEAVDRQHVLIGTAAAIGLFGLWRTYFSGATDVRADDPGASAVTAAGGDGSDSVVAAVDVVGETTTERVDRTIDALERGNRANTNAVVADLRESLRAVETAKGYSSDAADERIRRGEWTDDRIAAVFLGDESAGTLSLGHRLRRWLFPGRTFRRRLERTLAEMERYAAEGEFNAERSADDASSATMNSGTGTNGGGSIDTDGDTAAGASDKSEDDNA